MTAKPAGFPSTPATTHLQSDGQSPWLWLGLLLVAAFALRMLPWWLLPNVHHPDEVFQYLEAAHREVFGYGVVTWEYRVGSRSWLFPGFLAIILGLADAVGLSSPRQYNALIAATLSLLSLSVVAVGFLWAYRRAGMTAAVVTGVLCAVWFEVVYFAPKTLTEPIAAALLVIALYAACPGVPTQSRRRLLVAGLLFGLIAAVRINLAPALLVAAVYLCRLDLERKWLPLLLGGIASFSLAGLLDALTWDYPFQAVVNNIWTNVVENRSQRFGVAPWHYFIGKWTVIWGGAVVPIAAFFLVGARRNPLPAMVAITIVATHMLFLHKEYRFVFPAIPLIMIVVGLGTADVLAALRDRLSSRRLRLAAVAFAVGGWTVTSAILAVGDHFRRYWTDGSGKLALFERARAAPELCGLGLVGIDWWTTGGYSHLHRDVPIFIPPNDAAAEWTAYNFAIARPGALPASSPFVEVACLDDADACLYRRDGACRAGSSWELNSTLRRIGQ